MTPAENLSASSDCPRCAELRLLLAQEREKVNALRLGMPVMSANAPAPVPTSATPGPPPMRYLVVDAANNAVKRYLGPLHKSSKAAAKLAIKVLARKDEP